MNDGRPRRRLRPVPGGVDTDQVVRLEEFRRAHPEVDVEFTGPCWRAVVPQEHAETVITRFELRQLLDKLAELLGPAPDQEGRR